MLKLSFLTVIFYISLMGSSVMSQEIKAFSAIDVNSPSQMEFALNYAQKFFQMTENSKFIIMCGGEGVHLLRNEKSDVKQQINEFIAKYSNIEFFVCEETTKKMKQNLGQSSFNFIEGIEITSCNNKMKQMGDEGWVRIDTSAAD